jgi:hypothetical protein
MKYTPQIIELADGTKCVALEDFRRECDEARAERDILKLDAQREAEHHDRMVGELEKVYKERDEARAVAGELADVASKYLSFLLAVTPAKTNETHEKETMIVIDAIKRWKKL